MFDKQADRVEVEAKHGSYLKKKKKKISQIPQRCNSRQDVGSRQTAEAGNQISSDYRQNVDGNSSN